MKKFVRNRQQVQKYHEQAKRDDRRITPHEGIAHAAKSFTAHQRLHSTTQKDCLMDVNMILIRAFLTVARFSSFTQAALFLHVSQPTLTIQIRQLEDALNLRLFDRSTRHVRLTRPGRKLVPAFQNVLSEFETVVESARGFASTREGVVQLACLPSFATTNLPTVIAQFRKRYPHVSFAVKDTSGKRIIAMIRADEVDLGITDADPHWPDLEVKELYTDPIRIVYPKSHPVGDLARITANEIADYPLVLLDAESNSRTVLDAAFAAAGRLVTPACEVRYTATAIGMVRAGLGITLLGSLVIEASNVHSFSELLSRPVEDPAFVRRVGLIRKRKRSFPPSTQAFADLLLEFAEKNYWPKPNMFWPKSR